MRLPLLALLAIFIIPSVSQVHAAGMRCAKKPIKRGLLQSQIKSLCNKPAFKQSRFDSNQRSRFATGKLEMWTYQKAENGFTKHLYFVDGKLALIENGKRL